MESLLTSLGAILRPFLKTPLTDLLEDAAALHALTEAINKGIAALPFFFLQFNHECFLMVSKISSIDWFVVLFTTVFMDPPPSSFQRGMRCMWR